MSSYFENDQYYRYQKMLEDAEKARERFQEKEEWRRERNRLYDEIEMHRGFLTEKGLMAEYERWAQEGIETDTFKE